MKIEIRHNCSDFDSYRAARCKSLFNVESGCNFNLDADLPIDDDSWCLGLVIGPSGSGKTSIGKHIFGAECFYDFDNWPGDVPIIDAINSKGNFDDVTRALAGVGLGDVPAWLRPFAVLSNGEKFRANLARVICEAPERVVIDEFTSVVDRQIAKVGAYAFSKNWKRAQNTGLKKCVLLSCHYDIIDWLEPDWVYDIASGKYQGRGLWRRPKIELKIFQTNWRFWNLFREHHYLKVGPMPASKVYLGIVDGAPVAHGAMAPKPKGKSVEVRGGRLVIMPEWQGLGVGHIFASAVFQLQLEGKGILTGRHITSLAITSHPALIKARLKDTRYAFIKQRLYGQNINTALKSIKKATLGKISNKKGCGVRSKKTVSGFAKFGGHMRPTVTFRFVGDGSIKYEK